MRVQSCRRARILALLIMVLAISEQTLASPKAVGAAPAEQAVHCRVMETMMSAQYHVRLVIFHYRDAAERARLGELLRKYDGSAVRFQTSDGQWRMAALLRLKTCFGRGLLVFSASEPTLAKKQDFLLAFPASPENSLSSHE